MDRTHAGIARACDGFRTPDRRHPDGGAPRRAALPVAAVAVLAAAVMAASGAGTGTGAAGSAAGGGGVHSGATVAAQAARSGAALTVLEQSPFVGPGQAFTIRLAVGSGVPAGASLGVTVYQHLTSRSAFVQTLSGTVSGSALSSSPAMPLASLPADPAGGVDLTVPVRAGSTPPAAGGGGFTADLHCVTGGCGGVYPLRLQLDTTVGGTRPQVLTNLVYDEPAAGTTRLRVALVSPLSLPATPAAPSGAVPAPTASALASLGAVTSAFAAHPDVAATFVPSPSTLAALAGDGRPRAHQVLTQLQALSAQSSRQSLAGPYAAVDPASLGAAGLAGELATQVERGAQTLTAAGVHAGGDTWVDPDQLDQTTLGQLSALGFGHVVVPAASVSGSLFRLTPSAPVTVPDGHGAVATAALEDPVLAEQLGAAATAGADSVLAADQVLADLSLIYYEQPNLTAPRAVVALSPTLWSPDPAFLDTLLAGLAGNPVLEPATLGTVFGSVPTVAGGALHRGGPDPSTLPTRAIRAARGDIDAFATSVSDPAVPRGLSDLLLTAESGLLRPPGQAAGVAGATAALHHELGRVSITADSVRLTSSGAHVPVTIVKTAPYTVTAVMTLSSDKLLLPGGNTRTVVLDRPTNAVYVEMQARTAGVFRVTVTLFSPQGGLVMASQELTVRSMSASAVAIGLSLGAVAVLLLWWARTAWRRGGRRGAHARGQGRPSAGGSGDPGDEAVVEAGEGEPAEPPVPR